MNAISPAGADREPIRAPITLDKFMADDLEENTIVFIDEVSHRFLAKVPDGPHLFWHGTEQRQVEYGTAELLDLIAKGRYYRPGSGSPKFDDAAKAGEHLERIRLAINAFPAKSRAKAKIRYLYVLQYLLLQANHGAFARNHENAQIVIDATTAANDKLPDGQRQLLPRNVSTRTVLRWIAREIDLDMQEAGQLHGNAVKPRTRKLPPKVYELIAKRIRSMVRISSKFGPTKMLIKVEADIDAHNNEHGTKYPYPSLSTVALEYRRYDGWIRKARAEGVKAADLEYGAVGKLERPARILDLVEIDHHKFDLHPTTGDLGKTELGIELAKGGIDRFWVCLALDVHSGYPLGFAITFEPGGLVPAVMCIDHAIRPKPYVAERWPDINGQLLGYGKPVKVRYDNAKEFVSLQLQTNLARIGVGFELAIPRIPNSKPYVERHFGTIERDFVHWLPGSMGANIGEKGDRKPQQEAKVDLDAFQKLFHQYLIEVLARRQQEGLDWETPEERWVRGMTNPSHRPRTLTPYETKKWDLVTTLELDLNATREGIRWKNLHFQSAELQKLRRFSGIQRFNGQEAPPMPVKVRIPLLDIGRAYVAVQKNTPGLSPDQDEIVVLATNRHAHGRTIWQHQAVCDWLNREKKKPTNHADYKIGFLRLFRNAMEYVGMDVDGNGGRVTLSGGQAPRFLGLYLGGAAEPALSKVKEIIDRDDPFADFAAGKDVGSVIDGTVVLPPQPPKEDPAADNDDADDWGAADFDEDDDQ